MTVVLRATGTVSIEAEEGALDEELMAAARDAARSIPFTPARRAGNAVDCRARVLISFQLLPN
jgi:hypothetical protein